MPGLKKFIARTAVAGALAMGTGLACAPAALAAEAGYTATKYPIVMVHGLLGFDSILDGVFDYWHKIVTDLREGGAEVYVSEVSALNSSEARGEQLITQIKYVMATTGATKVHLIGHSHGSPTIRYVAAVMPDAVASVTSVGGLNTKGLPLADIAVNLEGKPLGGVMKAAIEGIAKLIALLSGKQNAPEDVFKAMAALNVQGMREFNEKYPAGLAKADCSSLDGPAEVNGIRYYSWSGNVIFTDFRDPLDYVFGLTNIATRMLEPTDRSPTDGLVSVCNSLLGKQLGIYSQNHFDEINNLYGMVSPYDVSPVVIYREHANRLMKLGL